MQEIFNRISRKSIKIERKQASIPYILIETLPGFLPHHCNVWK